ncbi:MAG: NAD-dependent epimerase/dehydratase family protein, partial [Chloroflexota bacterium]
MQGERIIVTGATGFIGRALVRQLLGQGAAVTAFVIESPGELAQTNF